MRAFETQELILPNPLEFLWDAFLHASFEGNKKEVQPLIKFL
jgi:hypothetical protein